MVVREILKMNTSKEVQAKLNDYYRPQETHNTVQEHHPDSLLSDPKKFEQLMKDVFCTSDGEGKRAHDAEDEENVKRAKVE